MMEAVARRKASWLFGAGSDKTFSGKRRPQEDMVTSAVFGSIRLMSSEDRRKAVEVLLGRDAFEAAALASGRDIEVELWPRLAGSEGRRYVEPDVLLQAAGKTVIVEVKWHAPLSEQQLKQQVEAVGPENVSAVVMLGEADAGGEIHDKPSFRRTWRDVSGELQLWNGQTGTPLDRWIATMRDFLHETDMGRIFKGLPRLVPLVPVSYTFRKPGHPPWLDIPLVMIGPVDYSFGEQA